MGEWKDLEKEQPEMGEQVLIYRKNFPIHMGYRIERDKLCYFVIANTFITFPVTHWMALPEGPSETI